MIPGLRKFWYTKHLVHFQIAEGLGLVHFPFPDAVLFENENTGIDLIHTVLQNHIDGNAIGVFYVYVLCIF